MLFRADRPRTSPVEQFELESTLNGRLEILWEQAILSRYARLALRTLEVLGVAAADVAWVSHVSKIMGMHGGNGGTYQLGRSRRR